MINQPPIAVYIHFPYCKSRCPYCDFFRGILPKSFDEKEIIEKYRQDIKYFADLLGDRLVKSVFFGGGTPSILSADAIHIIMNELSRNFCIKEDAEISLEANPNTFEREKFIDYAKSGINRLSLGVQALNEQDLKFLGRTHSLDDALRSIDLATQTFDKTSIDLIYSRPNQQWDTWQQEIDLALKYGLQHISLYQLSIEEGTVFHKKNVKVLDEETSATFYNNTVSYLKEKGLDRYEVSNFVTSPKEESIHNLVYWQGGEYIGIGEGAHGRILHDGQIKATVDGKISETLTPQERAEELVIMGLRIRDGINAKAFYDACGIKLFDFLSENVTKRLAQLNLLCYDAENIKLTDQGFLVLDKIILELLS